MKLQAYPFWLVGFRPFFTLAFISGALLPLCWVMMTNGLIPTPPTLLSPIVWHGHEMFYGFAWAVLGGFLLTATKNWLKIRGYHGNVLILLFGCWLLERVVIWYAAALPSWCFVVGSNLFIGTMIVLLVWSLWRYRQQDSFSDNYFFLIILPLFLLAKNLMLSPSYFSEGIDMTLALFRVAFLVMLERTLSGFMQAAFQLSLPRRPWLDLPIKLAAMVLVLAPWLPEWLAGGVAALLVLLLLGRFVTWYPHRALTRLDIGIMYLGYLALILQLLMFAISCFSLVTWTVSLEVHVFTAGTMGMIIPAMLIRISKGHTGRKVIFEAADKWVLWLMVTGFLCRTVLVSWWFSVAHWLAAGCWLVAFSMLAWRYIPYLWQARIDGKEH